MKVHLAVLSGRPPFFDALIPDRGMASLAAVLEREGVPCRVFDLNRIDTTYGQFLAAVRNERPDLVGFKFFDSGYVAAELLAREIRRECPTTRIVAGGPHVTLFQETIAEDTDAFDVLIAGDGEKAIVDLLHWIQGERRIEDVAGAIYRSVTGGLRKNPQSLTADLDGLPFPKWSALDLEWYLPIGMLNTYRGCPFTCAFCAHNRVWGYLENGTEYSPVIRKRSLASLSGELDQMLAEGLRCIGFTDSTPLPPLFRTLVSRIREIGPIPWTSFAYVGHFTREDFVAFGESGCAALWFGIESGNEELRRRMGKNFSNADVLNSLQWARDAGIKPIPGFIAGFPGDSPACWRDTHQLISEMKTDVCVISPFILDPGSPVALDPGAFGVQLEPGWQKAIARRHGLNEFEIHTHSMQGVSNVSLWETLQSHTGYPGYEADRNIAESEFAYLLARATGRSASDIVQSLDIPLKQHEPSKLAIELARIWKAVEQGVSK